MVSSIEEYNDLQIKEVATEEGNLENLQAEQIFIYPLLCEVGLIKNKYYSLFR